MSDATQTLQTSAEVVSSDREALILVDADDRETGHLDKAACHDGDGVLHRAFSAFILNSRGQLLIQQRAAGKRLWPGFWSNSCCSHPRAGEDMPTAVARRLQQELGYTPDQVDPRFVYKFEYQARFGELGSEHELCWVYIAHTDSEPVINTTEIDAWRWISGEDLDAELSAEAEQFTPWFKMEWARLREQHADLLASR